MLVGAGSETPVFSKLSEELSDALGSDCIYPLVTDGESVAVVTKTISEELLPVMVGSVSR